MHDSSDDRRRPRVALLLCLGALLLTAAWAAETLTRRVQAADALLRRGEAQAAADAYDRVLHDAAAAGELSAADRVAAADAALMLAWQQLAGEDPAATARRRELAPLIGPRLVEVVSHGERFDHRGVLAPRGLTIVDFSSKYCKYCVRLLPKLEQLAALRNDYTLVLADINRPGVKGIDWQAPVVEQYGFSKIPHLKIYDAEGKLVAEGQEARNRVNALIAEVVDAE